jgi:hypothetical protein
MQDKFVVKINKHTIDDLEGYRAWVVDRSGIFSFSTSVEDLKVKMKELIQVWTDMEEPEITFILCNYKDKEKAYEQYLQKTKKSRSKKKTNKKK